MEKQMTHYNTILNNENDWEKYVVPAVVIGIIIVPPTLNVVAAYLNNRTAKINYATELLRKTVIMGAG